VLRPSWSFPLFSLSPYIALRFLTSRGGRKQRCDTQSKKAAVSVTGQLKCATAIDAHLRPAAIAAFRLAGWPSGGPDWLLLNVPPFEMLRGTAKDPL